MVNTIGNPLSWGMKVLGVAGHDLGAAARELGGHDQVAPVIRRIGVADLRAALRLGVADFAALRTDVLAAALLYPIAGIGLIALAFNQNLVHLAFPLLSGFALLGPAAAVTLYEMSRRRETGQPGGWLGGFGVLASPRLGAILALAFMHLVVFAAWLIVAYIVYLVTLGPDLPVSARAFFTAALTTPGGWAMIALGIPAGFVFAALVLATSLVSFPMLLDRPVGLPLAVVTSIRVARRNPVTVALWGGIVVVLLVLGSLPFLIGLAVVMPVLGHATWHLYRRAVG